MISDVILFSVPMSTKVTVTSSISQQSLLEVGIVTAQIDFTAGTNLSKERHYFLVNLESSHVSDSLVVPYNYGTCLGSWYLGVGP